MAAWRQDTMTQQMCSNVRQQIGNMDARTKVRVQRFWHIVKAESSILGLRIL